MNRTVAPFLMASLFGTNAACDVPLPVIFTSTTAAACSAGSATDGAAAGAAAGGVAGAAWASDAAAFLSPPQAAMPEPTSAVSNMKRIARFLPDHGRNRLLNAFAIHPDCRK